MAQTVNDLSRATDYGKMMDKQAANKNKIEKLNTYKDYYEYGKRKMLKSKYDNERIKKHNDLNSNEKIMLNIAGYENMKKINDMNYEAAYRISKSAEKRINNLMDQMKDVPLKEVESYRQITLGRETMSWIGTKYVKTK